MQSDSEHSADNDVLEESDDDDDRGKNAQGKANIIVQTSFDAYFTYTASRAQTSANVFSELVLPLTAEEYNAAISSAKPRLKSVQPLISTPSIRDPLFSRLLIELQEGFNILCYGYGSKRTLLNQFAAERCSKRGHVVVANGFHPDFTIKDLLNQIENVPGLRDFVDLSSSTPEKQAQRVSDFFSSSPSLHLYLIIHNIDAANLRTPRARSILSLLALTPYIHIIASIDHINAPLIWSLSESSSRKPSSFQTTTTPNTSLTTETRTIPPRGYAWLYHDLTTLSPYDFELTYVDRTSLSGAHGGGPRKKIDTSTATLNPTSTINITMTETAALHILASVTQKAQKLFLLLGNRQLETIEELGGGGKNTNTSTQDAPNAAATAAAGDLRVYSIGYDALFHLARDNFIATNDTALRALLGEYRDHGLVVSAQAGSGSGEILWIPLRKERLASVLRSLGAQQQS